MKQIVIVGGSYAGVACAKELLKQLPKDMPVSITLIENRDARYHCLASYRGLVQAEFAKNLWIPYDNLFPVGSCHKVVRGTVTQVHSDHVMMEYPPGSVNQVHFDYLVIATGSSIPAPAKLEVQSVAEGVALMNKVRHDLENSQNIVIVGGGACGVEFAGETKYAYPNKNVTLIHNKPALVDYPRYPDDFKARVREYLEKHGVEVILNESVEIEGLSRDNPCQRASRTISLKNTNRTIKSDMQFFSIGIQVDPSLIHTLKSAKTKDGSTDSFSISSLIDAKTKAIHVRPTLQLDHDDFPNIFAIGDISNADPVPTGMAAISEGETAARNIVTLLRKELQPIDSAKKSTFGVCCSSKNDGSLEEYSPTKTTMVLAMNPTGGVSNLPVVGSAFGNLVAWAAKSSDLFSGQFWREMNMSRP
ncbi:Apoptosis-inducing factor 2 [Podila epigama]|nr:Apoptosis-inducing factor 2 [Podila epigama]